MASDRVEMKSGSVVISVAAEKAEQWEDHGFTAVKKSESKPKSQSRSRRSSK